MKRYPESLDVVVVGSGPGGYVAAIRAAQIGMKVGIVEKDPKFGGTCLHRGCIPTKALLQTAALYDQAVHSMAEFGIEIKEVRLNFTGAQGFKEKIVARLASGVDFLLKKNKVVKFQGRGRVQGPRTVVVGGETEVQTRFILLATGSVPKTLPHFKPDGERILTSDELLQLASVPRSLLVVGAGAVGIEFASMFHRFGSEVTMVEALPQIVPLEDEEVARELERILTKRGMKIQTGTKVTQMARQGAGVQATLEGPDGKATSIDVEKVLLAVGRSPVTQDLGLESTRVQLDRGYVKVTPFMQTDEPSIYAIGDIVPTPALAHVASAEGLVAVEHMKGLGPKPLNYDQTVNCTFCDPQVASIGLTEKKARERGHRVKVGKFPFQANSKAMILQETDGFVKIVSDEAFGEVLGVHILHSHASYLIGEGCAVLSGELPAEELARTIHPHPTLTEAVMEAAHAVYGLPIHM
ncbi:MAG TPA: dihydrolipoyl dehydrogenase [Planctomycetota bacterium]|nr:dihydrolipoyl dehydrogenase [Planctomycetota bacterium]